MERPEGMTMRDLRRNADRSRFAKYALDLESECSALRTQLRGATTKSEEWKQNAEEARESLWKIHEYMDETWRLLDSIKVHLFRLTSADPPSADAVPQERLDVVLGRILERTERAASIVLRHKRHEMAFTFDDETNKWSRE